MCVCVCVCVGGCLIVYSALILEYLVHVLMVVGCQLYDNIMLLGVCMCVCCV